MARGIRLAILVLSVSLIAGAAAWSTMQAATAANGSTAVSNGSAFTEPVNLRLHAVPVQENPPKLVVGQPQRSDPVVPISKDWPTTITECDSASPCDGSDNTKEDIRSSSCSQSGLYTNRVTGPSVVRLRDLVSKKKAIKVGIWASTASKGQVLLYMPNKTVRRLNLARSKRRENVIGQLGTDVSTTEKTVRLRLYSHKIAKLRAALRARPHLALTKLRIGLKSYPVGDYGLHVTSTVGLKAVPKPTAKTRDLGSATSDPIDLCNAPLQVKIDGARKLHVKDLFNSSITRFSGVQVTAYCSKNCNGVLKAGFRLEKIGRSYIFSNRLTRKRNLLLGSAPLQLQAGQQSEFILSGRVSVKIRRAVKRTLRNSGNTRFVNLIYLLNGRSGQEHKLAVSRSKLMVHSKITLK